MASPLYFTHLAEIIIPISLMHLTTGEMLGAAGVTLLLIAFLMNLLKKWKQESLPYILLNVVGAGLACASSVAIHFIPFIILEGTWTLVSLVALGQHFKKTTSSNG